MWVNVVRYGVNVYEVWDWIVVCDGLEGVIDEDLVGILCGWGFGGVMYEWFFKLVFFNNFCVFIKNGKLALICWILA